MDHFEEGLRGDIRSMIVGETFENFHEMYQRAVKIAMVLEESKKRSRPWMLGRKRWDHSGRDFQIKRDSNLLTTK